MADDFTRLAACRCGQLRAEVTGDPVRISVCHCLECQRRSGSAFAVQARWPDDCVTLLGKVTSWTSVGDSGTAATFQFCPVCGVTVAYVNAGVPGLTAIPVGTFADPNFPAPQYSVYEERRHEWVAIVGDGIEHWP